MGIFELRRDSKGDISLNFTDSFASSSEGVRSKLEQIIYNARRLMAIHYTNVEGTYMQALIAMKGTLPAS
jgi:hypothetical protein